MLVMEMICSYVVYYEFDYYFVLDIVVIVKLVGECVFVKVVLFLFVLE